MFCDVSVTERDGWAVVHLGGELDLASVPAARQAVFEGLQRGRGRLVLDLTDLAFVDSAGLGVLLGALRRVNEKGGELRVVRPGPGPRRAFAVTGLDALLPLVATLDDALASDGGGGTTGA